MSEYVRGQLATLRATFLQGSGGLVDPAPVTVDVLDPSNNVLVNNAVPTRISLGFFSYAYTVPVDAVFGNWRIEWTGIVNGATAFGFEIFEVVAVSVNPGNETDTTRLRARLGEGKTDPEGDGSETFFTDTELFDILVYTSGDLDLGTLEGWKRKAADFARLIDVQESGTTRDLSEKFKHAKAMVDYWAGVIEKNAENASKAVSGQVVGRRVNLRGTGREALQVLPMPVSTDSDVVVVFPDHQIIITPGP